MTGRIACNIVHPYVLIPGLFCFSIILKCNIEEVLSLSVFLAPCGEILHKHTHSALAKFKSQCSRNRQGLTQSNYSLMGRDCTLLNSSLRAL